MAELIKNINEIPDTMLIEALRFTLQSKLEMMLTEKIMEEFVKPLVREAAQSTVKELEAQTIKMLSLDTMDNQVKFILNWKDKNENHHQ